VGLSRNKKVVIIWFVSSVTYHILVLVMGGGWHAKYSSFLAASLPFSSGAVIYHFKGALKGCLVFVKESYRFYLPINIFLCVLLNWGVGYFFEDNRGVFFYSNYLLCSLMVLLLSERKALPFVSISIDKWFGDMSYPIYLIHYQVGLVVIMSCGFMGLNVYHHTIAFMLISVPFIVMVAWGLAEYVERPVDAIREKIKSVDNFNYLRRG